MNVIRRIKSIASGRSSVSDHGGDSGTKRVKVDREPERIFHDEKSIGKNWRTLEQQLASTSLETSDTSTLCSTKHTENCNLKHSRSIPVMKKREVENYENKDCEPSVVHGNGMETGHIISTSLGGRNGDPKKTVSYMAERVVGTGSFGVVFQAKSLETGEMVAIKKVLQDKRYKNRELQIMQLLEHSNVVQLKHCFFSSTDKEEVYLNLVLEYVSDTVYKVLKQYIRMNQHMPIICVQLYTYQICRALNYIHNVIGVCHRDIKPQNLLVDPHTHQLKICDFGSAKMLIPGEANISYICSRYYRAPELIFGATEYTTAIDIWSVGCVLAELILGHPMFPGESGVDQLVEIIKVLGTPSREEIKCMNPNYNDFKFPQIKPHPWHKFFHKRVPSEAVDLLSRMLQYSPNTRCSALEACAHPFFDTLRMPGACLPNDRPFPPLFDFTPQAPAGDLGARPAGEPRAAPWFHLPTSELIFPLSPVPTPCSAMEVGGSGNGTSSIAAYDPSTDPSRKTKSKDHGWKYAYWHDTTDKNLVQCILCGKSANGGIKRLKQYLVGGGA